MKVVERKPLTFGELVEIHDLRTISPDDCTASSGMWRVIALINRQLYQVGPEYERLELALVASGRLPEGILYEVYDDQLNIEPKSA